MKLDNVPNPSVAAEAIRAFQKRFRTKTCMAPTMDCQGPIVAAHTLSAEGMLRPISRQGHVYAIDMDIFSSNRGALAGLSLQGIKDTSVFNGFCQKHDRDLFAPIETVPFACTPEQCFLHAFRAAAKESYLKRKQAESIPLPATVKAVHRLPADADLQLSAIGLMHQTASFRGAEDVEHTKTTMDQIHVARDWRRLCTTVVPFGSQPGIVCNFLYAPDFDFAGRSLQDFEDPSRDLSNLMITLLPTTSGGFALLSYLDTSNSAPQGLIDSLLAEDDITSALVWLIACQTENFALSPEWCESLGEGRQRLFMEAFHSNTSPVGARINQLRGFTLTVPSWEPEKAFTL